MFSQPVWVAADNTYVSGASRPATPHYEPVPATYKADKKKRKPKKCTRCGHPCGNSDPMGRYHNGPNRVCTVPDRLKVDYVRSRDRQDGNGDS